MSKHEHDFDPDDELLDKTPEHVVNGLGFDPLDLEEDVKASDPGTEVGKANSGMVNAMVMRGVLMTGAANWLAQRQSERVTALGHELASEIWQDYPIEDGGAHVFRSAEKRIRNAYAGIQEDVQKQLEQLAEIVSKAHVEAASGHHGITVKPKALDAAAMNVLGLRLGEHFQKQGDDMLTRFKAEIRKGIENDDSVEDLVARVIGGGEVKAADHSADSHRMVHAAGKPLVLKVGILDTSLNSLSMLMQNAVLSAATDIEGGFFDDLDDDDAAVMGLQWVCALENTCDECLVYDGSQWTKDYDPVGDGPPYPGDPPEAMHPNCFPGDGIIAPVGDIVAVSKRRFDGDVVRIETAHHHLTCTPNHPILTDSGWQPAKLLNRGSRIVSYLVGECPSVVEWKHKQGETRFQDVADTFLLANDASFLEVPVASPDFHGDGAESEIAVVASNLLLANEGKPARCHHCGKPILKRRRGVVASEQFHRSGVLDAFRHWLRSSSGGIMRFLGQSRSLSLAGGGHSETHLIGSASQSNSSSLQSVSDPVATDAKPARQVKDARPIGVRNGHGIPEDGLRPEQSAGPYRIPDSSARDAELARKLLDGRTGAVELHEVLSVNAGEFHGDVFNAETTSGIYTVNGIIVHNCRCRVVPVDLTEPAVVPRKVDSYLKDQNPEVLAAVFGKAPARGFLEGELSGKELMGSGFSLSPEAIARLLPQMEREGL